MRIDCLSIDKDSLGQFCPLLDNLKNDKIIQNIFVEMTRIVILKDNYIDAEYGIEKK